MSLKLVIFDNIIFENTTVLKLKNFTYNVCLYLQTLWEGTITPSPQQILYFHRAFL